MAEKCTIKGCQRNVRVKSAGLCMTHYQRKRRTGSTADPERATGERVCKNCGDPHHARGFCMRCYQNIRRFEIDIGTWNPHDQEGQ